MWGTFKKYAMPLLLVLIIPQLVSIACCLMLIQKQMREVPTAVYLGDNTAFARSLVQAFDAHETFHVIWYAESPEEIPKLIEAGKVSFGLVIPKDFTEDIKKLKSPSLLTVIDGSQLTAASFTKITASEILLSFKNQLLEESLRETMGLSSAQAQDAVSSLTFQIRLLGNPTRNYLNFLMPGFMISLTHVGLGMAASASVNRETRKSLLGYLGSRILTYGIIGFGSMLLILMVQHFLFAVPMKSGLLPLVPLLALFSLAVSAGGVLISTVCWNKVFASQVAAIFYLPSTIISGYTWPLSSMPGFYHGLAWAMPFAHLGDILRDLLLKGSTAQYLGALVFQGGFALCCWLLAAGAETFRENRATRRGTHAEAA